MKSEKDSRTIEMKLLERKRTTDHEPLAQCPDCSGNGTYIIDHYTDGTPIEGYCETCEGRGSIPLQQYLLDIREEEILAEEVGA